MVSLRDESTPIQTVKKFRFEARELSSGGA